LKKEVHVTPAHAHFFTIVTRITDVPGFDAETVGFPMFYPPFTATTACSFVDIDHRRSGSASQHGNR